MTRRQALAIHHRDGLPMRAAPAAPDAARHRLTVQFVVLVCLLPLFGQTFYYLVELPVPYLLSKAWPVLVLPLTAYALFGPVVPYKALYATMLAYLIGISPILSMINFGSGLPDALTTTVKIWPFTFYLALAVLLAWLRPTPALLTRAAVVLGAATFVAMLLLWVLVPARWYDSTGATKLLLFEAERGYRIFMPMFFCLLFIFYLTRRFCERRELWTLALVAVCFVLLLVINKQRVMIGAAWLVVLYALFSATRDRWRQFVIAIGLIGLAGMALLLMGPVFERYFAALGGSVSVRQRSIRTAIDFLGDDPLRWLVGLGATTRFSTTTLADVFGDKQFYLADIGWLGIIFEYGIVGAILVAVVYVAGFAFTRSVVRTVGTPFSAALYDYAVFLLITSLVYSFVFTTGELATIMALAGYLHQATGAPVAPSPAPLPALLRRHRPVIHRLGPEPAHAPAYPQAPRPARFPG